VETAHVDLTSTDAPRSVESRTLCKDGTYRWIETVSRPVRGPDGNVSEIHSVTRDITERKLADAALRAAKDAAESANRAKSVFLGSMSHELRTPLHAILGFGRVLEKQRHGALNAKQLEYVRDIIESGAHMLALVEDLLELRRVEEKRPITVLDIRLDAAAAEAVRMIRELAQHKGHELAIAAGLPAVRIAADHRAVVQVLVNLLSNAIKYTPPGGNVGLHWEVTGKDVAVHVDDDGVGLTPEEQGRLFRDFERLGRTSEGDTNGTGLGLALTRRIIEELGGRISVTSAPGRGSRFTFTLPCVGPTSEREATA
jgi:signal transduction histidine kinase